MAMLLRKIKSNNIESSMYLKLSKVKCWKINSKKVTCWNLNDIKIKSKNIIKVFWIFFFFVSYIYIYIYLYMYNKVKGEGLLEIKMDDIKVKQEQ